MKIQAKNTSSVIDCSLINIICNIEHKNSARVADLIESILKGYNANFIRQDISPTNRENIADFNKDATFVITIGGDGTFLATSRFYSEFNTPILGINAGHLGFLAQLRENQIKLGLQKILDGDFMIDDRVMIKAETNSGISLNALNDIVIKGGEISRASKLSLFINDNHVCDYVADGLIISTPTGSTAYNLSAKGPIISPKVEALTITPICPHSLSIRPLVIPVSEKLEIKTENNRDLIYLTIDGQVNRKLEKDESVFIRKSDNSAKLVLINTESNNFYNVLKEKLNWGIALRK